jgi:hypothetical protein
LSIKQKVKLAEAAQEVHIHVPPADPVETLVRDSERNNNAVRNLVDERDELRKENQTLRNRVEFLVNANKHISDEREVCRQQSDAAFYKAGQMAATLDCMEAFIARMKTTYQECRDIADAHQQENAPSPRHVYDQQGIPLDVLPPAPTLEECESLSTVLARVD